MLEQRYLMALLHIEAFYILRAYHVKYTGLAFTLQHLVVNCEIYCCQLWGRNTSDFFTCSIWNIKQSRQTPSLRSSYCLCLRVKFWKLKEKHFEKTTSIFSWKFSDRFFVFFCTETVWKVWIRLVLSRNFCQLEWQKTAINSVHFGQEMRFIFVVFFFLLSGLQNRTLSYWKI